MEVLLLCILSLSNIACFIVGAKVGQKVSKGQEIEMPTVNPMEAYRRHEAKQEAKFQQDRIDTILSNIDSYDGTENGQKEVPRW